MMKTKVLSRARFFTGKKTKHDKELFEKDMILTHTKSN